MMRHGSVGTVESVKARKGEPLAWLFDVAFKFKDKRECLTWPFAIATGGYGSVQYKDRMRSVHDLVCRKTHGRPPTKKHQACHSCGNGHEACVNPHHVYWGTAKDNARDRSEHGTTARGESCGLSLLVDREVRSILRLRKSGWTYVELLCKLNVNKVTIGDIVRGRTWKHIER